MGYQFPCKTSFYDKVGNLLAKIFTTRQLSLKVILFSSSTWYQYPAVATKWVVVHLSTPSQKKEFPDHQLHNSTPTVTNEWVVVCQPSFFLLSERHPNQFPSQKSHDTLSTPLLRLSRTIWMAKLMQFILHFTQCCQKPVQILLWKFLELKSKITNEFRFSVFER